MTLKKNKGFNSYDLKGLTAGKLLAMLNALKELEKESNLSIVQADLLIFLENNQSVYDSPFIEVLK